MTSEPRNPFRRDMYDSLESFADHVSELLGCPITLEDPHHRVLVYSSHDEETDMVRISTIISRRVPEKVINRLWKDGVIPQLLQSKKPIRIKEKKEIGLGNRVAVSIWRGEEVIGYIWAIELGTTITEEKMGLLENAATVARHLLARFATNKTPTLQDNQEFFWRMLTGYVTKGDVDEKLKEIGISSLGSFTVMIFPFSKMITKEIEKHILYLLKVSQDVKISFSTIDDNELVILASPLGDSGNSIACFKKFISNFQQNLEERFSIKEVKGSFGGIYKQYGDVPKSFREARTVLEVRERFPQEAGTFFHYQELGIYQFLDILLEKRRQDGSENVAIRNLKEYDETHNTELLATLEVYLDEGESMQKTAARLHIHPNTLAYRLKRMIEIMEVDLSVPSQKFMIYLDLKLMYWQKE
ncbi:MAG: helix-turn-helix domain-containing protein [Niallia nealsonii]|uniref:PucR family transcriptional regulator n=1 Tax=Niallia circulans TaxID=1397 RepID=A0A941GF98_NIACI|nr:helix-turn-helix domain-containing protein [Niallia circulans]MCB5236358.1 helix-turn-helix domain-containing protein [Niallia circulans]MDU1844921.1 helix-turn-helix domain-containing protein [Niallia nealsonii]